MSTTTVRLFVALLWLLTTGGAFAAESAHGLTGTLAVVNKATNSLSVVDIASRTVLEELPTGQGPHEAIIANDGCRVVVSNFVGGDSLSVFDICALTKLRTINLSDYPRPHGIVFIGGTDEVLATSGRSGTIVRINIASGEIVSSVDTDRGPHMVALAGDCGYSTSPSHDTMTAFSITKPAQVRHYPVDPRPEAIAVTPDGVEVWVGSNAAGTLSVLDTESNTWRVVADGFGWPYRVAFTPDEATVLVPDLRRSELRVLTREGRAEATIDLAGEAPQGIIVHPDGDYAFQSLNASDRVAVVDLASFQIVDYLPTGSRPDGIAYSPFRHLAE